MKLFDKYLLACTNQRIPMPASWQESLGLALTSEKQSYKENSSEITGYRFQQDDVIDRGFVHRQVKSLQFNGETKYLLSLYLNAISEHVGTNFMPYLNLGTTVYQFPTYITKASIIRGHRYSIYGSTSRTVTIKLICTATEEEIYRETFGSLNLLAQKVIDTEYAISQYLNNDEVRKLKQQAFDEYYILEVEAYVPVAIVDGAYPRLPLVRGTISSKKSEDKEVDTIQSFTAQVALADGKVSKYFPVMLPSVGYDNIEYADKLMPTLLDMNITKNSPTEMYDLISGELAGETLQEKIMLNTSGIYDVDEFVGGKISW